MEKTACFIGHRQIPITDKLRADIQRTVGQLIGEEGVTVFLFGSRSAFDTLCHGIVTEWQKTYPHIRRIAYTCHRECITLKENKEETEQMLRRLLKQPISVRDYDGEYAYPAKDRAGKAAYAERNRAMIDDSDFCVFYFDETYQPPRRKYRKDAPTDYQPKSGTAIAYRYAVQKKKAIVNLYSPI